MRAEIAAAHNERQGGGYPLGLNSRTMPSHFDPAVLAAFSTFAGRFREIFETHRDPV